jgi:DNA polymerase-4
MSATRTMSSKQAEDRQVLESMLISLCTRLEQRMVKSGLFCKEVYFSIRYKDGTRWDTLVKLADPIQDAVELRNYIKERITVFERSHGIDTIFNKKTMNLGVAIQSFVKDKVMQYSLFDNRMKKDKVRKVMYQIKEDFDQKNIVRKGSELFVPNVMKDAIGFGSVRDLGDNTGTVRNKFLLEEDEEVAGFEHKPVVKRKNPPPPPPPDDDAVYYEYEGPVFFDITSEE